MKKNYGRLCALRLLCGAIDYLLLLLPVQLLMLGVMQQPASRVDFLFRLLFAVYGVLMTEYCGGATLGKRFGKLVVVGRSGGKAAMLYVGLRELVKSMYLIPVIGWIAGMVSVAMMLDGGNSLHDIVGGTCVIPEWRRQEMGEDEA